MQRVANYFIRLATWLGLLDTLAHQTGLHGLSWGRGIGGPLLSLLGLAGRPRFRDLMRSLPLALPIQIGLACLANPNLDPKRQLLPGDYANRKIERLDIPGEYGPIPALHISPTKGARAAVCIAHGSGADKTFYAWRLCAALLETGLAVLLIDMDGHGESPRPQSYPAMMASVGGAARWLRERYDRVGLLGMSLGGAVTANAVAHGATCDALVIWESPPRLRVDRAGYRRMQIKEILRIARPPLIHLFRDGTLYHIIMAWQTSGIRAQIGTWDLFDVLDLVGSLERIKRDPQRPPLLLVYAGRDAVLPPGSAQEVARTSAGWGEFHLLPRASHLSLPLEPEAIALSRAWLGRVLGHGDV
ncbi:alpha/beta hydrolase fold-containing protein [Oscillochloris trichoides DG-6]|uniref:Alpha/beta hydrolase fold-containing protein n=1 Tax=Oscillochloris trichoides DG-6 TaxID=765420 RepID=E1IE90_9CHLR|nr:alpha/beta fold hydrolase [Oscillochloris trichoides]EFO80416.1 alpha/beta hydrolase fold-containing protein [Oscillochloris trichoides DG-6]